MFILEGNIGSGKSTFLRLIEKHLPYLETQQEPVVEVFQKKIGGTSLLQQFYSDTKRWSFTFENFAMACRTRTHMRDQENDNPFRIIERSVYSGHYCFAVNGKEQGFMSAMEWSIHLGWFNLLIRDRCKAPRGFIYLRTQPEVAYRRTLIRSRKEEEQQMHDYLKQIHIKHEQKLVDKTDLLPSLAKTPVLVLDANTDFESDPKRLRFLLDQIQDFVHKHAGSPHAAAMASTQMISTEL